MRAKLNSLPFCHILLTYCRDDIKSCCLILTLQKYKFKFNFTNFIDLIKK